MPTQMETISMISFCWTFSADLQFSIGSFGSRYADMSAIFIDWRENWIRMEFIEALNWYAMPNDDQIANRLIKFTDTA